MKLSNMMNNSQLNNNSDKNDFQPLEERIVISSENGLKFKKPGLNVYWVEKRRFMHFMNPTSLLYDNDFIEGAKDAWIEQMEFLSEDLKWLLTLSHYKFWSQIIYDKCAKRCLESYLSNAPRWYDNCNINDTTINQTISDIHKSVFLVYLRLATFKESKSDFISPNAFGDLIYKNYLFDICQMLDLGVLFGASNSRLISKMISNVFTCQPKYFDDLNRLVVALSEVLYNIESRLGVTESMLERCIALHPKQKLEVITGVQDVTDIAKYTLDTLASVEAFISVFPDAAVKFERQQFHIRISQFYERVFPALADRINLLENVSKRQEATRAARDARIAAVHIFRKIVQWHCLREDEEVQKSANSTEDLSRRLEWLTATLSSCLEEKLFIIDYSSTFSIKEDIQYFKNHGADLTTLEYVFNGIEVIQNEMKSTPRLSGQARLASVYEGAENQAVGNTCTAIARKPEAEKSVSNSKNHLAQASGTNSLMEAEICSLVSSVRDVLPDLEERFIKKCLCFYDNNLESTLNALLEGTLPSELMSSPQETESVSPPSMADDEILALEVAMALSDEETGQNGELSDDFGSMLKTRHNVYDGDEFDVFQRPAAAAFLNEAGLVRKGKEETSLGQLDDHLLEKNKQILHEYESTAGRSIYDPELVTEEELEEEEARLAAMRRADELMSFPALSLNTATYEDEYDDTYDDYVGDIDVSSGASEAVEQHNRKQRTTFADAVASYPSIRGAGSLNVRPTKTRWSNRRYQEEKQAKEEQEQEEEENKETKLQFPAFCENPEMIRERQQKARDAKIQSFRGRGRGRLVAAPKQSGDGKVKSSQPANRGGRQNHATTNPKATNTKKPQKPNS